MPNVTEEALPPYHEAELDSNNILTSTNEGIRLEYNPRTHSHAPSPNRPTTELLQTASSSSQGDPYGSSLIYGSGVCIPPTPEQRTSFDSQSLGRLDVRTQYWLAGPERTMIRTFDAPSVYRSATSQLDVLLPLLTSSSPSPGQLPPQTSQRVITLHLPSFPQPSPVGRAHFMRRPHDKNLRDFDELVKYFQGVTWQTPHTRDQNLMRLLDLMECFVTRIALEGFFVSQ